MPKVIPANSFQRRQMICEITRCKWPTWAKWCKRRRMDPLSGESVRVRFGV